MVSWLAVSNVFRTLDTQTIKICSVVDPPEMLISDTRCPLDIGCPNISGDGISSAIKKIKMSNLLKENRVGLIKTAAILTAAATVLSLSGVLSLTAFAVAPSDYGLKEGDVVSAAGSDDPDVYIVNDWGYKRLFLNPAIFGFYGHLGGFAAVKNVSPATRDAFGTSGLFRVDGDEKVYGLESTGEDTAVLHWVNTTGAQAVADDPNFFKKVFVINQTEFNWYTLGSNYTSVSQIPSYARVPGATPTPPVATGPLSVTLAPGNPSAQTITNNATGVEYLRVRVSGTGTVNTVTVKRLGPGATGDFQNVYVYDGAKRLTSGKTFSSASGEATYLLNLAVSGTKDLSFIADMTAGGAGNVNYFQLLGVTASGGSTVSGVPLNGNNFAISGAASGRLDVAKVGSYSDPTVGQKQAQLSEFKLTANTEAASVRRLTMLNDGTLKPADLTNVKLMTGASEWSGTVTSDGYLVFDLGSGFTIAKGGNATFKVYGDVAGKKDETVDLYFETAPDVWAVGDQYGQGMNTASGTANQGIDALDAASESTTLTLLGGVLTLVYNGPNATTISTQVTDVTLLRFSMTAASNIEIKQTEFTICADTGNDGTYDNAATQADWDDLNDIKVWNEDTNAVVMGPADGTAFNVDDSGSCPDGATGAQKQFTDTLDLLAGVTYNFKVTGDVDTSLGSGTQLLDSDSVFKIILDDYSDDAASVSKMKYAGTNTAVASADIVPRADIAGSNITITSSALTLSLAGNPSDQTKIRGMKDVDAVGITFAAGQASDLKVTTIKITGYAADTTTFDEGVESGGDSVSVANAMSKVQLYEAGTGVLIAGSDKITSNLLGTSGTGTMTFSNLAWNIPAGTSKTMLVRVDLSNNTASGTAGDQYAFDIAATADVTSLDKDSNTVNPGSAGIAPNGTTSPTQVLTVKNSGSMTLAAAAGSPAAGALYWGQNAAPISKFRISATDEAQYLEKLTIGASVSNEATDAAANVKDVTLTYKNKAGDTLTTTQSFGVNASANFNWSSTDANRPYVPKDSNLELLVSANMKTKDQGATQTTGTSATALVQFSLDLTDTYNGSVTNGFRAVGEGSGTVIDGSGANIAWVAGAYNQTVYRVFPKFEQVALSAPYDLIGTPTVFKFSITAMGLADANLRFDNQHNGSGSIQFEIVASGDTLINQTTSTTFSVLDETGTVIDGPSAIRGDMPGEAYTKQSPGFATNNSPNGADPDINASISFNFTEQDIEIAGGQTRTFSIRLNNPTMHYANAGATGRAPDYFQVTLQDDQAGLINWVGNYDGTTSSLDTPSATGIIRSLPLYGPTFQR